MSSTPLPGRAERPAATDSAARVAELFERHSRMVYGVCRAMLRDGHDVEDATQQAFLSAYRALLGGAHVRDEGAWIATIARNECRARIGAAMRTPLPLADEDLAAIPASGDDAERRLHADALRSALAALPERQRQAVVLRDLYGLRYAEVATALGLSRPATEALLFRARRALRQRLRPVVATTLAVPIAVQEGLAQAIPGFTAGGSGAVLAGAAGGGVLAKLTTGPVAAKFATAAVAVTTVGTVGTVESDRAGRGVDGRAPVVAAESDSRVGDDSDRHGSGRHEGDSRADDSSGPGGGDDSRLDEDNSGPGSSGRDAADDSSGQSRDATSSGSGSDDSSDGGISGRGGSGSGSRDGDSSGPGSGGSASGSSGSGDGSSGSGSGGSGSSGTGSGEVPADD